MLWPHICRCCSWNVKLFLTVKHRFWVSHLTLSCFAESDPAAVYSSVHRTPEISYAQIPIKTNCRQRGTAVKFSEWSVRLEQLFSQCLLFNFLFYCKSEMVQLKVDDDVRWKQGRHIIQQSISSVIQKQKIWLLLRHIYIFQY